MGSLLSNSGRAADSGGAASVGCMTYAVLNWPLIISESQRGIGSVGAIGSHRVNREPTPNSLCAVRSPPMRRASCRLIERPSPVPRC